jgi:endonuclease/exonuclease/phosphatase family metal-dependent hydrolase
LQNFVRPEKLFPMPNRSKTFVIVVVVAVVVTAIAALIARDRLRCAGFPGPAPVAQELPGEPPADGTLRIVSWNIRNFPIDERPEDPELGYSRRTNICDLEEVLAGLDGDVLGLQEVNDTRRFPPILRRAYGDRQMGVRFSAGGGRFGQHLAIAWDVETLELVEEPVDVTDTVLGEGMRPAFAAYLRSRRPSGIDFTLVVVHHESGPGNFGDRRRQNRALADWINARVLEIDDPDVVLLGDFNTTGSPKGGLEGELQSMDAILGSAGLLRLPNETGCSSYWEGGGDPDGVQRSSLLDHVFLRGFTDDAVARPLEAWLHCARFGCSDLISRVGEEDGTFWDVSDHCPLTFEIRDANLESHNSEF